MPGSERPTKSPFVSGARVERRWGVTKYDVPRRRVDEGKAELRFEIQNERAEAVGQLLERIAEVASLFALATPYRGAGEALHCGERL